VPTSGAATTGALAVTVGFRGKVPSELFRTCGCGRWGAWAHAANARRLKVRSARGVLFSPIAKFRTL
jgi:hypothetical protein